MIDGTRLSGMPTVSEKFFPARREIWIVSELLGLRGLGLTLYLFLQRQRLEKSVYQIVKLHRIPSLEQLCIACESITTSCEHVRNTRPM